MDYFRDVLQKSLLGPEPDNEHLSEFTDLSDYGQGEGRFFFFNLSTTISTAQAVALVLGITAVLGSIAALAFFFMLNMGGGGKDDSSHGSGYGSGSGGRGHSGGGSGYGSGGGHASYSKRSLLEESELLRIVSLIHDIEQVLEISDSEGQISKECKMSKMCRTITNTSFPQAGLLQTILDKAESEFEVLENNLEPHPLLETDEFDLLNRYKTTADIAKAKGHCMVDVFKKCQ